MKAKGIFQSSISALMIWDDDSSDFRPECIEYVPAVQTKNGGIF
jgi:hypothetical protein